MRKIAFDTFSIITKHIYVYMITFMQEECANHIFSSSGYSSNISLNAHMSNALFANSYLRNREGLTSG